MTNPIAQVTTLRHSVKNADGTYGPETVDALREVIVYCPGCKQRHHFTVEILDPTYTRSDGSPYPTWQWNGSLENPTFSPSLLCYSTVHLCEGQHTYTACDGEMGEDVAAGRCGHRSHGYFWENAQGEQRIFKVYEEVPEGWVRHTFSEMSPHTANPWYGNCHSFLRDAQWQFLGDSAHALAGQTVPVPPLPDWLVKGDG